MKLTQEEKDWGMETWSINIGPQKIEIDPYVYVREYKECPDDFNLMVHSIWRYFDMVYSKSAIIEDLYLNFLEFLELPRFN